MSSDGLGTASSQARPARPGACLPGMTRLSRDAPDKKSGIVRQLHGLVKLLDSMIKKPDLRPSQASKFHPAPEPERGGAEAAINAPTYVRDLRVTQSPKRRAGQRAAGQAEL